MTTRRSFLTMLGLSPIVAAGTAVAAKDTTVFAQSQMKIDTFVKDGGKIGAMLRSPSGDFEVDLNNGRMTWYSDDDDVSDYDPEPFDPRDDEYEYDDWSH